MIKIIKNRKCIAGCLFLMLAGGIFLCGCQKQETETANSTESTEEIKLEKGQSWVYGQIASINGNEMTYYIMEEETDSDDIEESEKTTEKAETSERGERPQMPEGGPNGERPEGFEGERPQMAWRNDGESRVKEEETVTVQIPVGTKVTTRLGTETTFSRLAAGDHIKMLVQENDGQQEILEIWMVD